MKKLIKFEIYRLFRDRLFWIINIIILMVNFIMFAGKDISVNTIVQKLFLTTIIVSMYAVSFIANDYEQKGIIYEKLSGNSEYKIILAKTIVETIGLEIQLFVFPLSILAINMKLVNRNYMFFLLVLFMQGIFLSLMTALLALIVKNRGIAIGITIIIHIIFLLSMNSSLGYVFMNLIPIGLMKLVIEGYITFASYFIRIIIWDLLITLGLIFFIKKIDY